MRVMLGANAHTNTHTMEYTMRVTTQDQKHEAIMAKLSEVLATVSDAVTRIETLEAKGERHAFMAEPVKAKRSRAKAMTKVAVKRNQSHADMKALVKAGGKKLSLAFSKRWMQLRQEAGFGTKGNITPKEVYFALQAQAYADVA